MKNIYEPMDDFGGKVYDFNVEYMDNWYTGLDELKHSNITAVKSFGTWCEHYKSFSNNLYNTSKTGLKYCGAAISSLELNINAGMGIGGKFDVFDGMAEAELIWSPVNERWKFNSDGGNVEHVFTESIGISALNYGIRAYNESTYNEMQYQSKGCAYADMDKPSYGVEVNSFIYNIEGDFANKSISARRSYTLFDFEAYAILGGGLSLSFDVDEFLEKVNK